MTLTDPWPERNCTSLPIARDTAVAEYEAVLADARDERPLQTFLAEHAGLLTCLLPPGQDAWCFDRPRFGAEFVPDLVIGTRNSAGFQWSLVELENPTKRIMTSSGLPSKDLNQALGQIRDWRSWLRSNIAYAQDELGFKDIDAECPGFVVIGRRHTLETRHAKRYRELSTERTIVMTYDRLGDVVRRDGCVREEVGDGQL